MIFQWIKFLGWCTFFVGRGFSALPSLLEDSMDDGDIESCMWGLMEKHGLTGKKLAVLV